MKSTSEPAAMRWTPGEAIFVPSGELGWMRSHAALPVPLHLHDDVYRVYVSGRTERNQAQIGYIEVDLEDPAKTLRVSGEPVIRLGGLGAHDESGVTGACVVRAGDRLYQYYTGWSLMTTVPFVFHIGLAISEDGGETFEKVSEGPVLGRSRMDPYLVASPSVLIEDGAWRMWYVSGARWEDAVGGPKHYYHIRYAESRDGIDWRPTGRVCIDFLGAEEYAFGRPMVRKISDGYEMWYCVRGDAYRIGYARSTDGLTWTRLDDCAGVGASGDGWDAQMQAYPYAFDHAGKTYLLYNGNDYGRTGVGLAVSR